MLTSDRPVIMTNHLLGADAHIALPIGPRFPFLASPNQKFLSAVLRIHQVKLIKDINRYIVERAGRFVYGRDDKQFSYIEKHFGVNPQPRWINVILKRAPNIPA